MRLQGKVALVTGAGRGIGRVIARDLAREGSSVVLNDWEMEAGARESVDAILASGGQATFYKADVSVVEQVQEMVRQAEKRFGRLDILVNNAAVDPTSVFLEVTEEFWKQVIDTNLKGVFFCAQAAARVMVRMGKGRIINISSVHSQATMPGFSVYAASKGGINSLTRELALELAAYNICVNAIAPGAIEVERFVSKTTYNRETLGKEIPLGRVGYPVDVSAVVLFLASDAADWLTGQVITVDGGTTTRLFLYTSRRAPATAKSANETEQNGQ